MAEITFQNKEDASQFHNYIQHQVQTNSLNEKITLQNEDDNKAKVKIDKDIKELVDASKAAFLQFIIKIKLHDWFRMILKEKFYYEDEDEIQQILDIIYSIVEGEREDLESLIHDINMNQQMEKAVSQIFDEQHSFSFDSFVRFRMRPYMEQLEKYVEISIDEYKMEQEYQMFIQTLRQFISERAPKIEQLHLYVGDGVTFYDQYFSEIKRAELIRMIDRKLISNHPVYIDSVTIAPLLSISPSKIYVYTDDEEEPLVRTIQNIFEERVRLRAVDDFQQFKNNFFEG
ncbi:putative sporulation protein YtxC [Robertmurraya sp. DFI.2.37]|uniref:putative sporulation protein YtxC n=1 Tax=Robertmurraya sp. DFI.2.37 TaxID=3031819 RepID=UPI00124738BA|nr:putative sporulation protein YtxC [Robertmurraya sp. DFI.2.37]MDF1506989.1 putative sporulation protein YtxC [Robertmurraya sp. DFI.2.37]